LGLFFFDQVDKKIRPGHIDKVDPGKDQQVMLLFRL
jgi:hypothetical protein